MHQISTLSQLLTEFENQMLIYPERRGIKHFFKIVEYIKENSSDVLPLEYFTKVKDLTEELQPEDSEIYASECWNGRHLIFALGKYQSLSDEEKKDVRIRQGEFDKIEREERGDYEKTLKKCLELFERKCQINQVSIDVTQHVIDLLQDDWKYIADNLKKSGK